MGLQEKYKSVIDIAREAGVSGLKMEEKIMYFTFQQKRRKRSNKKFGTRIKK
jgi:hypothetical protein